MKRLRFSNFDVKVEQGMESPGDAGDTKVKVEVSSFLLKCHSRLHHVRGMKRKDVLEAISQRATNFLKSAEGSRSVHDLAWPSQRCFRAAHDSRVP